MTSITVILTNKFKKVKIEPNHINFINVRKRRMLEVENPTSIEAELDKSLSTIVTSALERYFSHLDGAEPIDLYKIVIGEFEPPLLEAIMYYAKGNQVRAAKLLGMSRGTLRKKLTQYFNTTHVGTDADRQ